MILVRTIAWIIIFIMLSSMDENAIAAVVNIDFQGTGERGYSAKGVLSYQEKLISEQPIQKSDGQASSIDNLTISFYNPSGELLGIYDNIQQGLSQNSYFQFNFDPQQKQITGLMDLGGDSAGEIYLKGIVEKDLTLFKIDQSGKEIIYDHNLGLVNY